MADKKKKEYKWQKTQGNIKIERYFEELLRSGEFKRQMRKLRSLQKYKGNPRNNKHKWVDRHGNKNDNFDKVFPYIYEEYKLLKKISNKYILNGYWRKVQEIAERWHITPSQVSLLNMRLKPEKVKNYDSFIEDVVCDPNDRDMCNILNLEEEIVSDHFNPGKENLLVNMPNKVLLQAYPIAICISPLASKRDVLDFVEKRWWWIENNFLRAGEGQSYKGKKRKHKQEILDFIWKYRNYKGKYIKEKLDKQFPGNGLAYYEISKILDQEFERRI